jgi:hypothetical protein
VPTFFARNRERSAQYAAAGGSENVREVTANLRIAEPADARPFFRNGRYDQEAMRAAGFDGFSASTGGDVIVFRPRTSFAPNAPARGERP